MESQIPSGLDIRLTYVLNRVGMLTDLIRISMAPAVSQLSFDRKTGADFV